MEIATSGTAILAAIKRLGKFASGYQNHVAIGCDLQGCFIEGRVDGALARVTLDGYAMQPGAVLFRRGKLIDLARAVLDQEVFFEPGEGDCLGRRIELVTFWSGGNSRWCSPCVSRTIVHDVPRAQAIVDLGDAAARILKGRRTGELIAEITVKGHELTLTRGNASHTAELSTSLWFSTQTIDVRWLKALRKRVSVGAANGQIAIESGEVAILLGLPMPAVPASKRERLFPAGGPTDRYLRARWSGVPELRVNRN